MRKLSLTIAAALLTAAPAYSAQPTELTAKQQAKYDRLLAGRTAGEAKSCISIYDQRQLTIVSDDVLIFSANRNAKTVYVNKPYGGCNNADRNILVYDRTTPTLCAGDIVQLVDRDIGGALNSCAFGEFIPYTKDEPNK